MSRRFLTAWFCLVLITACLTGVDARAAVSAGSQRDGQPAIPGVQGLGTAAGPQRDGIPLQHGAQPVNTGALPATLRLEPAFDKNDARRYIGEMPRIRKLIGTVNDRNGLVSFGSMKPSAAAMSRLRREIAKLSSGNHHVSLLMVDLRTKSGVAYRSSVRMCTQSTVKAVYTGSVLDAHPDAMKKNGRYIRDAVRLSDNEAYKKLRGIYGTGPLRKWCREVGVDEGFARSDYPRSYTARDMFRLWTKLYCFLNSNEAPDSYSYCFADSSCSAAGKTFGRKFSLRTKAGWESGLDESSNYDPKAVPASRFTDQDPENDECAINDTGIIYSDRGPYLFVIYTDIPFGTFRDYTNVNPLYDLTRILYDVQCSIGEKKQPLYRGIPRPVAAR